VAVAIFHPKVAPEDFKLHLFTAFVSFNTPLEHQRFLDSPPLEVDGYSMHFIKHDDGENAHEYDMDREVWLPLLGHPLDARSTSAVTKSVSSFVMLPYVHESNVLSWIVI
jgi:hypothetical protein